MRAPRVVPANAGLSGRKHAVIDPERTLAEVPAFAGMTE